LSPTEVAVINIEFAVPHAGPVSKLKQPVWLIELMDRE